MAWFVTMCAHVEPPAALRWGPCGTVAASICQIVAPADVAFSLNTQCELAQLLWAAFLRSCEFPAFVGCISFWLRHWSWRLLRSWLLYSGRRHGQHKHCNPGICGQRREVLVQSRRVVRGLQGFGLLLCKDCPKFLIRPHYLIQLDACEPSWHLLRQRL